MYRSLRNQALNTPRQTLGVPEPSGPEEPWGVLMETGYAQGSATVVAFSDGNASIYFSGGGGFIGGHGHEKVRQAATAMVGVAAQLKSQLKRTGSFLLPAVGQTLFYVRTDAGILTGAASEKVLGGKGHPLSPLFYAGQAVITQYRSISEKSETKG